MVVALMVNRLRESGDCPRFAFAPDRTRAEPFEEYRTYRQPVGLRRHLLHNAGANRAIKQTVRVVSTSQREWLPL